MRSRMAVLSLCFFVSSCASAYPSTLCEIGESLFECQTGIGRVALCGVLSGGNKDINLQFRFQAADDKKVVYPEASKLSAGKFYSSETSYSGGGEERIRFVYDNTTYIIYDKFVQSEDKSGVREPLMEAGLLKVEGNKVVSNEKCFNGTETIGKRAIGAAQDEDFNYDLP